MNAGTRRVLVSQTRPPEVDRDSGSQQVDLYIRWLLEAGWSVTFIASASDGESRHARRLRQLGVPVYIGYDHAEEIVQAGGFDLAVLAFWEPASRLLPVLRRVSPQTRVIVDSVDLHFLRDARRMLGAGVELDDAYGGRLAAELNTYAAADAVLTVSDHEADLLGAFLHRERVRELPVAKPMTRSEAGFADRSGMFFVGNFRHLPNGEAVEYLCRDIVPSLDPELRDAHPLSVIGSRLDEKVRSHARGVPDVRMIGWVPSIRPYLSGARVCVVPLRHGAGVKGKIIESLLAGTPVVTTPVGAEGLGLVNGVHAIVADTTEGIVDGLTRLLTDEDGWRRMADAGYELAAARHAPAKVGERFLEMVADVLAQPVRASLGAGEVTATGRRETAYRGLVQAIAGTLRELADGGSKPAVVSRGDDRLTTLDGRSAWHFPRAADGGWAGYHPADSQMAIRHLEELRDAGASHFVLPGTSFWWLSHYRDFFAHLDGHYRRIHSSAHALVFDLNASGQATAASGPITVRVPGATDGAIARDVEAADGLELVEREDADWTLHVGAGVEPAPGFVADLIAAASALAPLGIERVQPAHASGPEDGPPATERHRGIHARELEQATPIPFLAVRRGAQPQGPTVIVDSIPVELRQALEWDASTSPPGDVRDVFVGDAAAPRRAVHRSRWSPEPRISVLIATYDRPELLAAALEGFCSQTLAADDFEVVVVDDGTPGPRTEAVLREYSARVGLTWVRIERAGRSAAKNLALMLASAPLVLWFDDDDVPEEDLLEAHLRAHERRPEESIAILGHTEWSPRIERTPLMHYLTDVDAMLFAYGHIEPDTPLGWRCFWEGRVSSKRALHLRHGLHDQRLDYSVDVEMAWRLAEHELEVFYEPAARSLMLRPITFEGFLRRCEDKGRAQAAIASFHDSPELRDYLGVGGATERWSEARADLEAVHDRIRELEAQGCASDELHGAYRTAFRAAIAKGIVGEPPASAADPDPTVTRIAHEADQNGGEPPLLTVTMPVWSRKPELAEMAVRAIDRVWEVARVPTEVLVVDNGSPEPHPGLRARVFRFDRNQGVASGWNKGIELARAPVVAVLNSDCWVDPGWDEALYEAVMAGRRIAFPYTDHCDGRGFRQPDQAGTAGWCFMLTKQVFDEVGTFDERFNPAYVEDTDYWHRAWELGVELAPVPAAHVTHARRTSADKRSDWLLTAHRYMYGWKHGVEPMRAPPYYKREIVEYTGAAGEDG